MNPKPKKIISRAAAMLLTVIMAFAGAQTAGAQEEQTLCNVKFDISSKGTVELHWEGEWLEVTNDQTIVCRIPSSDVFTLTPETGYYVSSVTYDAPDGLSINLIQKDDFHWNLNIDSYLGSDTPTITVHIVFDKGLAGGADEALAVALTADDDLSHLTGGWYKVESDLTFVHTVNLHGDTHITIASGATLTVSTSDEYGIYGSALTVSGEGTLAVSASNSASNRAIYVDNYTQTGCAVTLSGKNYGLNAKNNVSISGGSLTTSGADYGIDTNIGSITISGGTVSSSGKMCGLFATRAMNITGGTVSASASGNVGNGIRGLSVSITGGQVTASSGGIWSRVGDITLGLTSATDYITASGFTVKEGKHVKIADGQTLYGGGFPSASYTGTIGDPSALNGLMLRPAAVTESGTNEYTIWNADGWDAFCYRLAADDGKAFFSGKTVKLGADITVSRMAGSDNHEFTGTFDGGGHTLTFTATAADNYCAPFANVKGGSDEDHAITISNLNVKTNITANDYRHAAGLIALQQGHVNVTGCNADVTISSSKGTNNPYDLYPAALVSQAGSGCTLTVSGCTATGTISTDGKYAAGLVGIVQGTATITDCLSSVTINSSTAGDGTHGGIVAVVTGSGTITGCVFNGKLLSKNTGNDATGNCAGFVAWGNGTISNCLYAPAAIEGDEAEVVAGTGDYPSGTFYRGTAPTVTNCYYTRALGTAQGKQLRTIAAGEGVTLGHDGVATEYSVSGITAYKASGASGDSDPFIEGILYDEVLYAGSGDEVSLTLANSAGEAPLGYYYPYSVTGGATLSGSTLTMPDQDVAVNAALRSTGVAVPVSYVDAGGNTQTAQAIALDGTESELGILGEETWYFVGADIAFDHMLNLSGDVNLILADGSTMNVTSDFNGIEVYVSLTIYGQTDGTGTLNATGDNEGIHSDSGNITISGGRVTATSDNGAGIYTDSGNLTISGGRVSATGGIGINTNSGTITLGCTTASDFIYVSRYVVGRDGRLNIADGQTLFDEDGNEYSGDRFDYYDLAGKTLRPYDCRLDLSDDADNTTAIADANGKVYNVTLQGRTLYKDGDWNTLCLPFDISTASGTLSGDNVQAMTLNTTTSNFADGTLTLNFTAATGQTIPAGTPFIIKWDNTGVNIENPVFVGVTVSNATNDATVTDVLTFTGTYAPVSIPADGDNTKLYLGAANKLYYPNAAMTIGTHRAYFQLNNGLTAGGNEHGDDVEDGVRAFVLNFGDDEATGIITTNFTNSTNSSNEWYTLDGRKLDGQPTAKGLYIHGGKKVAIK